MEPGGQSFAAQSEATIDVRRCLSDTSQDPSAGREPPCAEVRGPSTFVNHDSLPQDAAIAIPWRLDVSLRGPEAQELHTLLLKLAGNSITQLILMRMKQTTLQRSPLAVAISHRLRKS